MVVVVHGHLSPHVRKVNVNTSIAWATIFWGLGCPGGSLVGMGPHCTRIDKPHDDGVDAPPGAAALNSDARTPPALYSGADKVAGLPVFFTSFLLDLLP